MRVYQGRMLTNDAVDFGGTRDSTLLSTVCDLAGQRALARGIRQKVMLIWSDPRLLMWHIEDAA